MPEDPHLSPPLPFDTKLNVGVSREEVKHSMMYVRERKRGGFTIIELLIVIAIIAILAAVAIPALLRAQKSGKESAALQVLKSLHNAEQTFKVRSTANPKTFGTLDELKADGSSPVGEDEVEPASGYTFASEGVTTDTYTIIATPPKTDMITYTLNETGAVTP